MLVRLVTSAADPSHGHWGLRTPLRLSRLLPFAAGGLLNIPPVMWFHWRAYGNPFTPGHQMLYLKLKQTGPVLLSGDLYHYPEERTLDRVPTFEFDSALTRVSRVAIEAFVQRTGAQLWTDAWSG